jgi:hypothetical protein
MTLVIKDLNLTVGAIKNIDAVLLPNCYIAWHVEAGFQGKKRQCCSGFYISGLQEISI